MRSDEESLSSISDNENEEEWEDADPEEQENLRVVSLFDDEVFPDVSSMTQHCKDVYDFNLVAVISQLRLDFYSSIKLVNYIRSEVKNGSHSPDVSSADRFADDKYLQPVIEDDALLFSLGDLLEQDSAFSEQPQTNGTDGSSSKVAELEQRLQALQLEFAQYKRNVEETLDKRWNEPNTADAGPSASASATSRSEKNAIDEGYFDSYSYNEIHEVMLKDTVRTDAYRDFIYDNKHLFAGKTVLDVGCGTGILSMFCARAGAAKVIAVDNSDIIEKARANVHKNGLDNIITCLRGKIEEVTLPLKQVDIIVSEWMGYCLLFEAMLDSVLYARDRYLTPDGLMVPSHCVLHVAPFADPEFVNENFDFWLDVYGFDMTAMMEKIYDDVLVQQPKTKQLCGESSPFYQLPLHTVTKEDLSFTKDFQVRLAGEVESLDGWVIWFDTFFLPSRQSVLAKDARAEEWRRADDGVAFTTAPLGQETHWRSGVLIADRKKYPPRALAANTEVTGSVSFRKGKDNPRALEIEVNWWKNEESASQVRKQTWYLK